MSPPLAPSISNVRPLSNRSSVEHCPAAKHEGRADQDRIHGHILGALVRPYRFFGAYRKGIRHYQANCRLFRLYSLATLVRRTLVMVSAGKCPKVLPIASWEWGQVEFGCGKSLDHMQLS